MSDAVVIEAKGVPVPLLNGYTPNVRFGLRAIKELEARFGSTGAVMKEINAALARDDEGVPIGKAYTLVWDLLLLGLRREGLSEDDLEDLIDESRVSEYVSIILDALAQGLGGKNTGPKASQTQTSRSRGKSSTTSPPSLSIAQTSSSGT